MRRAPADNSRLDAEVIVPLKYLSNVRRSLDLLLIICEIEFVLRQVRNCTIFEISITVTVTGDNSVEATTITSPTFQVNNARLYDPVVTLSINDNIKFLQN